MADNIPKWFKVLAFLVSPVDSTDPRGIHHATGCCLPPDHGRLGAVKLVFWMVVSVIIAVMLSQL
jgi:hypothetical protein